MKMKLGIDIVYIPRFEKIVRENQKHFEQNVFCPAEWKGSSGEKLAGIFAAKEATLKALGMRPGQWQEICVKYSKEGRPFLKDFPPHELSISHDGEYAFAAIIFYE